MALANDPVLAPNAPPDKPARHPSASALDKAIAPYVARAKASYPQAKNRFQVGLPKGESFFITTRLEGPNGAFEQVFIAVTKIKGDMVEGKIWNNVMSVKGYRQGQIHTFSEQRLLDWLITKPDGSEEGNFVGKFLDTYSGR
jgi:hypothetical protein